MFLSTQSSFTHWQLRTSGMMKASHTPFCLSVSEEIKDKIAAVYLPSSFEALVELAIKASWWSAP